jgi:hypothetical protein
VATISDEATLSRIVLHDTNGLVVESAARRISDQSLLRELALSSSLHPVIASIITEKLADGEALVAVLRSSPHAVCRRIAVKRIGDVRHLHALSLVEELIDASDDTSSVALRAAYELDRNPARVVHALLGRRTDLHPTAAQLLERLDPATATGGAVAEILASLAERVDVLTGAPEHAHVIAAALNRLAPISAGQRETFGLLKNVQLDVAASIALPDVEVAVSSYSEDDRAALAEAARAYWECESGVQNSQLAAELHALEERLRAKYAEARKGELGQQAFASARERRSLDVATCLSRLEACPVEEWAPGVVVLSLAWAELPARLRSAARVRVMGWRAPPVRA